MLIICLTYVNSCFGEKRIMNDECRMVYGSNFPRHTFYITSPLLLLLPNKIAECLNEFLMRPIRPTLPLPHGRDKRRIFAISMWLGLRPLCMIRVVPGTFCQGSIIIIYARNRKNAGRLVCGAQSCSGGFADRSSEAPVPGIARRVCYNRSN